MPNKTAFFHDERCLWHSTQGLFSLILPTGDWVQPPASAGLAESPESKRRAVSLLQVSGVAEQVNLQSANPASEEDLLRVHTQSYLDDFRELSNNGGGEIGVIAPFGPGSYEIAKQSAGLAINAVDAVLSGKYQNAYSMSRPPGHHCLPDKAMGFCLLANVSIAVEAAKARHGIQKVAILDWDVHHGNGTQNIFYDRDDVLTISIHQEGYFPAGYSGLEDKGSGAGEGYNINIPLIPGGGHDVYQFAIDKVAVPAIKKFNPDLIVIASGYDAGGFDPLGRMLLHSESYRLMTEKVMALSEEICNKKLVVVHEGGYSETHVPFCVQSVVETLADVRSDAIDPSLEMMKLFQPNHRAIKFQEELLLEIKSMHKLTKNT